MPEKSDPYILSVDIGTSGIRSSVFDPSGIEISEMRSSASSEGGAEVSEVDPVQLLDETLAVLDQTSAKCSEAGISPGLAAVSCFWHSLFGIDGEGSPASPLFLWSETRPGISADRLRKAFREKETHNRTGCHFHSSYWPAKLVWIREEFPDQFSQASRWISFSDLLHHRLTGKLTTSVSMASGTGLFDIRKCAWDPELVTACGLYPSDLSPVAPDGERLELTEEFKERWPAFRGSKWIPAIGDGAANNIGAGCITAGPAALMVGTSAAVRVLFEGDVPERIPEGLFCYRLDRTRVVLGGALSDGGSLHRWLSDLLGDRIGEEKLAERYSSNPPGYHGLSFLPFVFGERSTGYHTKAEGAVVGLTRGTDAADLAIAAMESIAFRLSEILVRIETVKRIDSISVSGGAVRSSPFLTKVLADTLGRDLTVSDSDLASLQGAALFGLEAADVLSFSNPSVSPKNSVTGHDPHRYSLYRQELIKHRRFYKRIFPE